MQEEKEETLDMLEQGQAENRRRKRNAVLKVLLQAASLTFLAEWGDRSQLATVVLATREHAVGVVVGGSLGHALCTGLAVIGGRMVAAKISVRTGKCYIFVHCHYNYEAAVGHRLTDLRSRGNKLFLCKLRSNNINVNTKSSLLTSSFWDTIDAFLNTDQRSIFMEQTCPMLCTF